MLCLTSAALQPSPAPEGCARKDSWPDCSSWELGDQESHATCVPRDEQGKVDGISVRAPVPTGSVTDLVVTLGREVTRDEVNAAYAAAASNGPLADVLHYSEDPLVSTDIVGNPNSCIFDSQLTMAQGRTVKVFGWYDNEWGYSCRLVDLIGKLL